MHFVGFVTQEQQITVRSSVATPITIQYQLFEKFQDINWIKKGKSTLTHKHCRFEIWWFYLLGFDTVTGLDWLFLDNSAISQVFQILWGPQSAILISLSYHTSRVHRGFSGNLSPMASMVLAHT